LVHELAGSDWTLTLTGECVKPPSSVKAVPFSQFFTSFQTLISHAATISHGLLITGHFNLMLMTQKIQMPSNFSHFLIPATLLNWSIFLLIAVVTLWISSILLQTRHCLQSSLTPRYHLLIIFLFSVNSIYNHHVLLLSGVSHSDALMPFTLLILFMTFILLLSSTILRLFQNLSTATT
jgi:hypothetical protein